MGERDQEVEVAILKALRLAAREGCAPKDLHARVAAPADAVRDAVSRLWDRGEIVLGADRRFRLIDEADR